MRRIGKLDSRKKAGNFSGYLYLQEIDNTVEEGLDGQFEIWVHDDDHVARAEGLLTAFLQSQDAASYDGAEKQAARARRRQERAEKAGQRAVVDGRQIWSYAEGGYPIRAVTLSLMLISIGFYLFAEALAGGRWPSLLFIKDFQEIDGIRFWVADGLTALRRGQVWRLVTPIFLHFTLLHLVFNMMWLMDLGSSIEYNRGSGFLLVFVLLVAALSNLGQYAVAGPNFGGMSGVVYGLLGYAWMMGRYDPGSGLKLRRATVTLMLSWFVLCILFTRYMPVANTAHAVGLGIGVVWGFVESGGIARTRRRWASRRG